MVKHSNLTVAAIQMVSSTRADDNMNLAARLISDAASRGAQLVLLPEYFCIMGKHDTDKVNLKEGFGSGPLQDFLANQAKANNVWLIGGTIPISSNVEDLIYNSTLV